MKTNRRRLVCGLTFAWIAAVPVAASAQWTVFDPTNYAENALQYAQQLTQIKYQVNQLKYQLQALTKLGGAPWRDIRSTLTNIETLMGSSGSVGYAASGVGGTFHQLFPTASPVRNWPAEQLARARASVGVLESAIQATADQQKEVAPGSVALARMKDLNGSVTGHEQALELQNAASVYSAEELMLLRQAAMTQTNIQAVYYANALNSEVQRDLTARETLAALSVSPVPGTDISLRIVP